MSYRSLSVSFRRPCVVGLRRVEHAPSEEVRLAVALDLDDEDGAVVGGAAEVESDALGERGELRELGGHVGEVAHASVRREDDVEEVDEYVLVAPVAEDGLESCVGEDVDVALR